MTLLMTAAAAPGATPYHFWSCLLYSLCLTILYISSTLYHSFFMLPYAKDILQVRFWTRFLSACVRFPLLLLGRGSRERTHDSSTEPNSIPPKTQVLDHVGIYLLIAGSYSPFMMIALHHNTQANVLLVVEWLTAFVGICVSIGSSGVDISNQATNLVEVRVRSKEEGPKGLTASHHQHP